MNGHSKRGDPLRVALLVVEFPHHVNEAFGPFPIRRVKALDLKPLCRRTFLRVRGGRSVMDGGGRVESLK
jgi:hypothetical protein